jgi:hypothetical protein
MCYAFVLGFAVVGFLTHTIYRNYEPRPANNAWKSGALAFTLLTSFWLLRMLEPPHAKISLLNNLIVFDMIVAYALGIALGAMFVRPVTVALHGTLTTDSDGGIIVHDAVVKEAKTPAIEYIEQTVNLDKGP